MSKQPRDPAPGDDASKAVDDTADEIAALATLISQARELVKSGHVIDLAGLSEKVSAFCAGLARNPPDDIDSVARMIEALVGDLNRLAHEIAEQHQRMLAGGVLGREKPHDRSSSFAVGGAAAREPPAASSLAGIPVSTTSSPAWPSRIRCSMSSRRTSTRRRRASTGVTSTTFSRRRPTAFSAATGNPKPKRRATAANSPIKASTNASASTNRR